MAARIRLPFPDISPELFAIEIGGFPFALRWYALAYIGGFLIGWRLIVAALMKRPALWPAGRADAPAQVEGLLTWGDRASSWAGGWASCCSTSRATTSPIRGDPARLAGRHVVSRRAARRGAGRLAVRAAQRGRRPRLADAMALVGAAGAVPGAAREFHQRRAVGPARRTCPGAWSFPARRRRPARDWAGPCARHPTQLYEAGLEGLLLGAVCGGWSAARRAARPGAGDGVFLAGYGAARFLVEFWREADAQFVTPGNPLGHVLRLGEAGLSMGQLSVAADDPDRLAADRWRAARAA
jgi:phosphatidylglycerol---prolipoprotein diacylglyceryl transferase